MKAELRQKAIQLRMKERLGYGEIAKVLSVSKSTLSYWLRDLPLSEERILELRRDGWRRGEAKRERFRATMREKRVEKELRVYQKYTKKFSKVATNSFFVAGLMLYLGEGDKRNYARVGLVNTDPRIIKFFIAWMVHFLDIPKQSIRAHLNLYGNMNLKSEIKFWKDELRLRSAQFYKPTVRKLQKSSFSYQESYRHGTCGIYFGSVEKKMELMMAMKAFIDKYM